MKEMLYTMIANSERALVLGNVKDMNIYYCNEQMTALYGVTVHTSSNFMGIFQEENRILKRILVKQVRKSESSFFYNIVTRKIDGTLQLADLRVGYVDRANSIMFMEITPKEDTRMETALAQVNQSTRAEGIFLLDEKLSLVHCNEHLYEAFDTNAQQAKECYDDKFSNSFHPDIRENLLSEIHEKLHSSDYFNTKLKVIASTGEEKWYSLELQKRTLDTSGQEKVMIYMVSIEHQVKMEEQLDDISQYLSIIQQNTVDILCRIDIETNTMYYFNELDGEQNIVRNFHEAFIQRNIVHPDDQQIYQENFNVFTENDTISDVPVRFSLGGKPYQWYKMTGKKIFDKAGKLKEVIGILVNVQNEHDLLTKFKEQESYLSTMQDLSSDILFEVDIFSKTLIFSKNSAEYFGIPTVMEDYPQSVINSAAIHPEDVDAFEIFGINATKGIEDSNESRIKVASGTYEKFRMVTKPWVNEQGNVVKVLGKMVNLQSFVELQEKANFDSLTNALNKRAMLDSTTQILAQSRKEIKHALFFMDLDDFKYVNDNLGHAFGDFLLSELGTRLHDSVRQQDLVGRVGGDEFVIFLRDIPSVSTVMGKAKMLLSTISEDFNDGSQHHNIHGSLGIAVYPDHGSSYEELYHHADLALYSSKHKGKNQVTMYSTELKGK